MLRLTILLAITCTLRADDRNQPPTVDRQVEPEWDADLQNSFLPSHIKVEMVHLPAHFASVCGDIIAKAKQIFPETASTCDVTAPDPYPDDPRPSTVERIRVGGDVQQAQLIKRVTPVYPPEAKARGIQGKVEFTAVIGKSGKIQSLVLDGAPLALYPSAREAVLQWEYRPTLLNSRPVEVITRIDVNYELRVN